MSKYTTEVRFICETLTGYTEQKGYKSINDILSESAPKIFNFDFPIFDENYRLILERKILKHFYTREICEETVGLWKLRLDTRLNEIMPYYNKLYDSELLKFNPLYDVDYTITGNKTKTDDENKKAESNGTKTRTDNLSSKRTDDLSSTRTDDLSSIRTDNLTQNENGTNYEMYSDTPQGALINVENGTYLTNATKTTTNNTTTNTGTQKLDNTGTQKLDNTGTQKTDNTGTQTIVNSETLENTRELTSTDEYAEHVIGKRSATSFTSILKEFRETFLNIDMMVINDLNDLFFGLWE